MKCILLSFTLLSLSIAKAQQKLPANHLQVSGGISTFYKNKSLKGVSINTEYTHYFRKKTAWSIGLGGAFHDASIPVFYTDPALGIVRDGSLRETVGGIQISAQVGQSLIRNSRHELQAKLGTALRYQSSSQLKGYIIFFGPVPDYSIINYPKQRTITLGGTLELAYNYTFKNGITMGLLGSIQQHIDDEQISRLSISIGKRF
jgi:hypothetical protein